MRPLSTPLRKERLDDLIAFLYVEAEVQVGDVVALAAVGIGRGPFGDRGHDLATIKKDSVDSRKNRPGSESSPDNSIAMDGTVDRDNVPKNGEEINPTTGIDTADLPEPDEEFDIIIRSVTPVNEIADPDPVNADVVGEDPLTYLGRPASTLNNLKD